MHRTRKNLPVGRITRHRSSNANNEGDVSPSHVLAHEGNALPNSKPDESTGEVTALPRSLLLLASEWLFVKDLLVLGMVNRSFRDTAKDGSLWQGVACHLWKAALVDWRGSSVDVSHARLHKEAPDNLTLQDVCQCMAGIWPTHITVDDRPWQASEPLQGIVNGKLQRIPGSLPRMDGEPSPQGAGAAASAGEADNDGGEGDGSGVSGISTSSTGRTTGVVFRGKLGGDRSVRANLPFPWMGYETSHYYTDGIAATGDSAGLVTVGDLFKYSFEALYPHVLLGLVRFGAPFGTLWPGHANANGVVASPGAECLADARSGGGGGNGNTSDEVGDASADSEVDEDSWAKLERLPSSGPAPFFRVGYTAYFEITLGQALEPLVREELNAAQVDQCVAIGLARDSFGLIGNQPGWDRLSWGFHSDDGLIYHKACPSSQSPTKFGPGDTVGCGLIYPWDYTFNMLGDVAHDDRLLLSTAQIFDSGEGGIFFTKNGRYLGTAFRSVDVQKPLFPCVGLDSHYPVECNFGKEAFAFDLPRFEQRILGGARWLPNPSAAIRRRYCEERDSTNPRLLLPHLRLLESYNNWYLNQSGAAMKTGFLGSESHLLRRCLERVEGDEDDSEDEDENDDEDDSEDEDDDDEDY